MKNTQIVAERIKIQAKRKGLSVKKLLESCNLGVNTVTKMSSGTDIVSQNLLKIADCLECSVDYLLGRTDTPDMIENNIAKQSISNSNFGTVNGNVAGNVSNAFGEDITINNGVANGSDVPDEYAHFVSILDSLEKWDRKHAIIEIERLLENEFVVKKNND